MKSQTLPLLLLFLCPAYLAAADFPLQEPTLIQADGEWIDTGASGGHTGPCLVDLDQDGLRDLVIGDFLGEFRFFRNVSTTQTPEYNYVGYLQSEGKNAQVKVYCCIGSSPHFCDLNGDGALDMLSGCYSPGSIWFFPGIPGNDNPLEFGLKQELMDKDGKRIDAGGPASWPAVVDWDADGDLDLIYGTGMGYINLRINIGTKQEPIFDAHEIALETIGENPPQPVVAPRGHAAVNVGDWDRDGRFDLVVAGYRGGVYWYRNVGTPTKPAFDPIRELIPPTTLEGSGTMEIRIAAERPERGVHAQVFVTDYDQDGWLDLLVGDYTKHFYYQLKPEVTQQQKDEFLRITEERRKLSQNYDHAMTKFVVDLKNAFQGTDEAFLEHRNKELAAWTARPERRRQLDEMDQLTEKIKPFLTTPDSLPGLERHGYLWLYLRKPPMPVSSS